MAASYIDESQNLLGAGSPTGDEDAQTWSSLDPLGDMIFGWGDASKNAEIRRRQAQIQALQGKISADQMRRLEEAATANNADWASLTKDILGESGTKLDDFYSGVQAEDAGYYDQLKQGLSGYDSLEDLFSNPNFYGDVGDVTNAVSIDPQTKRAQQESLAQMRAQSTNQETAQERFQRLVAQQEAEANMKGARDSIARDLKARGVYGSGAEVVQNMMAQADAANRRYMANQAANAQSQQRATQMLGMGADLSSKMRTSDAQEGALANQVSMFNNQVNQNLMNQRSAQQLAARAGDNTEEARRASTIYQAGMQQTGNKRADDKYRTGTLTGLTQGKIGTRNSGVAGVNAGAQNLSDRLGEKASLWESEIDEPLIGGGIG